MGDEQEDANKTRIHLETDKQRAITWREYGYTAVIWSGGFIGLILTVGFIILLCFLIPAIREWTRANKATAAAYEEALPKIDKGLNEVIAATTAIRSSAENAEAASSEIKQLTLDLRTSYIPGMFNNIQKGVSNLNGVMGDVRATTLPLVNTNLSTLNTNQIKLGQVLDVTRDGLRDTLVELVASGKNIRLMTDDPALKSLASDIQVITKSLGVTAGKLEVIPDDLHNLGVQATGITTDLHNITTDLYGYEHKVLHPDPVKGFWPHVKKYSLQTLGVIKDLGGTTFLVLKVINQLP